MADITDDLPDDGGDKRSYEVGYGKPPRAHRFKPGGSGNPKGRRKGQPNLKTFTDQELSRRQWVVSLGLKPQKTRHHFGRVLWMESRPPWQGTK